jgi:hypothetical protein
MIYVEGKTDDHPIFILIDYVTSHRYIDPKIVKRFALKRCKHENYWLVKLTTGTKRKINEIVKDFLVVMNGFNTYEWNPIVTTTSDAKQVQFFFSRKVTTTTINQHDLMMNKIPLRTQSITARWSRDVGRRRP